MVSAGSYHSARCRREHIIEAQFFLFVSASHVCVRGSQSKSTLDIRTERPAKDVFLVLVQ